MFKSWSKKNKIKAVFQLQFQATQVPTMKKSKLMISLVPDDVGKPTVRIEKAAIQDGTCLWENPIFESVKLVRDAKSGKLHEKIYHFIVSTGSSKSGYLGEASIDFADFAAETEPLTVSLPLKFANSGAILHVTIQNVEGCTDQRNGEDNEALGLHNDVSLRQQLSYCSTDESSYNIEDGHLAKTRSDYTEQNATFKTFNGASPSVASWEESNSENNNQNKNQDSSSYLSSFRKNSLPLNGTAEANGKEAHVHMRSNTDWSMGSASDRSLGDSSNSLEDNLPSKKFQEPSDNATEKLKGEIDSLMRQAEVSELELQSLRRQIAKESSRGQNLSRQIISLREERDVVKTQYEQLKSQQNFKSEAKTSKTLQSEIEDVRLQLEATKEELVYEKELSTNLQLQLQKTQNSNSELLLAVRDLEAMLEQKNKEILDLSSDIKSQRITKEHDDSTEVDILKQKIADLNGEIDIYDKHNEELNEHLKELSLEYELLKKENVDISLRLKQGEAQQIMLQNEHSVSLVTIQQLESQADRLEEKIKKQADEFSESLVCINELENQVKSLEKELTIQAEKFEADLSAMKCAKLEQEERATQAEEALRKTRQNNAITSERFEEEYRMLSVEMASKVEENEKMTMEALTEADELRKQNNLMEEMLQKCNQELRLITDQNELKLQELLNQIDLKGKTIEQMSQELENRSKQFENAQRDREEKDEAFIMQIQTLRSEIKKLMADEYHLSKPQPIEHMIKNMMQENKRSSDLEQKFSLTSKGAETAPNGLPSMTAKDKKEMALGALLSQVEIFTVQRSNLKHSLHKEQVEKENMKKKVSQLQGELKKKEAELTITEKKLKNNKVRAAITHVNLTSKDTEYVAAPSAKAQTKKSRSETPKGTYAASVTVNKSEEGTVAKSAESKDCLVPRRSEIETCSANELTVFEGESKTNELLTEVALLKERNRYMENELKEMEERYSEISLKFAEVEGERQQLVMTLRNIKNGKKN